MLLAAWAYLLAEIAGKQAITIQVSTGGSDQIISLKLNLAECDNFQELIKLVTGKLTDLAPEDLYPLQRIGQIHSESESLGIIPFFYGKGLPATHGELLNLYDLRLGVFPENSSLFFLCEYNEQRLVKEKVKEIISLYTRVTRALAQELEQSILDLPGGGGISV